MIRLAFVIGLILVTGAIAAAQDPANFHLIYGNRDGSPLPVHIGTQIEVPIWGATDPTPGNPDTVVFMTNPLSANGLYIISRDGGIGETSCDTFLAPEGGLQVHSRFASLQDPRDPACPVYTLGDTILFSTFLMSTSNDPTLIGQTVYPFAIGGMHIWDMSDGVRNVVPAQSYGGLYFVEPCVFVPGDVNNDGVFNILESCLIKYRPKFIYTQPDFHNPTGMTMSLKRRKELLKLAYYYNIPILEDNPYGELYFSGSPLPSLKSLDSNDYVIYLSSFSKTISFSLRVGYVVASENIINRFIKFKQITDIQTNTHSQFFIHEFISQGHLKPHLDIIRCKYKKKRDLMISELNKFDIEGMKIFVPNGGYFVWLRLPDNIRMNELIKNLGEQGVIVMPGDVFYSRFSIEDNYIRLNYSYPKEEDIKEGVSRLISSIKKCSINANKAKYSMETEININPYL